jgi:hypothetical protein
MGDWLCKPAKSLIPKAWCCLAFFCLERESKGGEQIIAGGVGLEYLLTNKLMYTMRLSKHPIPHLPIWIAYFLDGYTFFDTQTFWCSWVRGCDAGFLHVGSHNFPGKYMGARTGSCAAQALILCQIAKVSWNVCLCHNSTYYNNGIRGYPLKDSSSPFWVIGSLVARF